MSRVRGPSDLMHLRQRKDTQGLQKNVALASPTKVAAANMQEAWIHCSRRTYQYIPML